MSGPAEAALSRQHSQIVEQLHTIVGWTRPRYATSSGFRYTYDNSAASDIADVSAPAHRAGVLFAAVSARPLRPPDGPDPGTLQHVGEVASSATLDAILGTYIEPEPGGLNPAAEAVPALGGSGLAETASEEAAVESVRRPSLEALLSVPRTVAGRERAEQACRAFSKGWYEEAEGLFLAGVEANPIDPFSWFGAGLSAGHLDVGRAATHLEKASRFLVADDPAGAVYVAIVAASLYESANDRLSAQRLLERRSSELGRACPAISIHLGRLGATTTTRLTEALSIDPMLHADLVALDLASTETVVAARRPQIEQEIAQINDVIASLRGAVDEVAVEGDDGRPEDPSFDGQTLSLVRAEVVLWTQIRQCEHEIDLARRIMDGHERSRRQKEDELERVAIEADGDLDAFAAIRFFAMGLAIALAIVLTFILGSILSSDFPFLAAGITFLTWLAVAGWAALAWFAFMITLWPSRRFVRARSAKVDLEVLEWQVGEMRSAEFAIRRQFFDGSEAAERVIAEIIDKRDGLVPRRPVFLSSDLPLVPAR